MSALAIILGRAGSKGVPGKNMRPVAGKPCAQWTIEHAQRSSRVGSVLVSSDDPALLELAQRMGCDVHERSAEDATDTATVDAAARAAVASTGTRQSHLTILYANVPVRPADLSDRALALLAESGADSVQSYAAAGKHHPWWTARLDDEGNVGPWEGDVLNHNIYRRQDLPRAFVPDGGIIALTRSALMLDVRKAGTGPHAFFGVRRRGIETGEGDVIDIDTPIDLVVADAVLRERLRSAGDPDQKLEPAHADR